MPVQRYRHLPLWGQFLNRHGALSPEKSQPFSQRMAAAANLQGLISCFALAAAFVDAPINLFQA